MYVCQAGPVLEESAQTEYPMIGRVDRPLEEMQVSLGSG